MTRIRYRAFKGPQLQEESFTSQPEVQEAKVKLYRELLQAGKLTHVEVRVPGQPDITMVKQQKEGA